MKSTGNVEALDCMKQMLSLSFSSLSARTALKLKGAEALPLNETSNWQPYASSSPSSGRQVSDHRHRATRRRLR